MPPRSYYTRNYKQARMSSVFFSRPSLINVQAIYDRWLPVYLLTPIYIGVSMFSALPVHTGFHEMPLTPPPSTHPPSQPFSPRIITQPINRFNIPLVTYFGRASASVYRAAVVCRQLTHVQDIEQARVRAPQGFIGTSLPTVLNGESELPVSS